MAVASSDTFLASANRPTDLGVYTDSATEDDEPHPSSIEGTGERGEERKDEREAVVAGEEEETDGFDFARFQDLKKQRFQENLNKLDLEISELHEETHAVYLEQLVGLQQRKHDLVQQANLYSKYMQACVHERFNKEKIATDLELQRAKESLKADMMQALQEKKRKLEEERSLNDLNAHPLELPSRTAPSRKLRYRLGDPKTATDVGPGTKRVKVVPQTGPTVKHILDEDQINIDLNAIRNLPVKTKGSSHRRR